MRIRSGKKWMAMMAILPLMASACDANGVEPTEEIRALVARAKEETGPCRDFATHVRSLIPGHSSPSKRLLTRAETERLLQLFRDFQGLSPSGRELLRRFLQHPRVSLIQDFEGCEAIAPFVTGAEALLANGKRHGIDVRPVLLSTMRRLLQHFDGSVWLMVQLTVLDLVVRDADPEVRARVRAVVHECDRLISSAYWRRKATPATEHYLVFWQELKESDALRTKALALVDTLQR
jgi:hypothetical protein